MVLHLLLQITTISRREPGQRAQLSKKLVIGTVVASKVTLYIHLAGLVQMVNSLRLSV